MDELLARLGRLEAMVLVLVERQPKGRRDVDDSRTTFTTAEFAEAVGLGDWTIRNYCRLGRLRAKKKRSGRGAHPEWVLDREEMDRYRREGLLDG